MEITEVRIHLRNESRLKAFATVTFDNTFVVHNMKVINGNKGLIVCMPSRKIKDGSYKDIAHPITNEFRNKLEKVILDEYNKAIQSQGNTTPTQGNTAAVQEKK